MRIQYLNDMALKSIENGDYLESMDLLSNCLAIMKREMSRSKFPLDEYKCQIGRCSHHHNTSMDHQGYSNTQNHHYKQTLISMEPLEIIVTPTRRSKQIDGSSCQTSMENVVEGSCSCDETKLLSALLFNMALAHQLLGSQTSSSTPFSAQQDYLHNGLRLYELAYRSFLEISSSCSSSVPSSESSNYDDSCSCMAMILSNIAAIHIELGNNHIARQYHEQSLSIIMLVLVSHQEQRQQQQQQEEREHQQGTMLQGLLDDVMPVLLQSSCRAAPAAWWRWRRSSRRKKA